MIQEEFNYEEERLVIDTKTIKNTKKHADYDFQNGKEHYKRAKKYKKNKKYEDCKRECVAATEDYIDSCEKHLKVNAEMHKEENELYTPSSGKKKRKEKIKLTHKFSVLVQAKSNSKMLTEKEVKVLDKYIDEEHNIYSSHTALGYGEAEPSIEEVEEIKEIAEKIKIKVDKKIEMEKKKQFSNSLSNQIDKILDEKDIDKS